MFNNRQTETDQDDTFIIGDIVLSIPPESISTSRIENDEEIVSLRSKFPMFRKTGQSIIAVTINWKALLVNGPNGSVDYTQWKDLRRMVAIFKAAPFVQVQNTHLSNVLNMGTAGLSRMAFGLQQLTITTSPDSVDVLDATMVMVFFNYLPYSPDFAYTNSDGKKVDSDESDYFSTYIDTWLTGNLNSSNSEVSIQNWDQNNTGNTTFKYRFYKTINQIPNPSQPANPTIIKVDPEGWTFDYATTQCSFFYLEGDLEFYSGDGYIGDGGATITTGVTVNLLNNLAQIPLSSYSFPTYQHLGPATTTIGISLYSSDPDGSDIGDLQNVISKMNNQYLTFRSAWRRTDKIHAMQAIYIENQILNMLGITAVLPSNLKTDTDREALAVQAQFIGKQYENIFETSDPYRIIDPTAASATAIAGIANPSNANSLNANDKAAMGSLMAFYAAEQANSLTYIQQQICVAPANPQLYKAFANGLGQLPQITYTGPAINTTALWAVANQNWSAFGTTVVNVFPGMASRQASGKMSFTDAVFLTGWALNNTSAQNTQTIVSGVNAVIGAATNAPSPFVNYNTMPQADYAGINNALSSWGLTVTPTTAQAQLYQTLFYLMIPANQSFKTAVETISKQPQYQAAIAAANASQPLGPGSDSYNDTHGAYQDLGLNIIAQGSFDFNPAYYFYNHSKELLEDIKTSILGLTTNAVANVASPAFCDTTKAYINTTDQLVLPTAVSGLNGSGLFSRMTFNINSPITAFPTFKLFLIEDAAGKLIYAYDEFYSYSSVQSIEVIKYRNKPDMAMVKLSNLAGILSHRLYDNSVDAKREWSMDLEAQAQVTAVGSNGTITGPDGVTTKNNTASISGTTYTDGVPGTLKYYPLQTGSKIQVRMGYANNPDKLFPVFSGIITEISEENELITLMAQSFLLELDTQNQDGISTNGWDPIGTVAADFYSLTDSIVNIAHGAPWAAVQSFWKALSVTQKSPAYGGVVNAVDGTTDGVIRSLVQAPSAKHFGRWQINAQGTDPFLRGFTWGKLIASSLPSGALSNAFYSSYDRSGDNILINTLNLFDGTVQTGTRADLNRPWNFEETNFAAAKYFIPGDPTPIQTPWAYMMDVSRRYPEYILAVKNYGFPYNCDATLVFANPLDYYRSRPTTSSDNVPANDLTDTTAFRSWWTGVGRTQFLAVGQQISDAGIFNIESVFQVANSIAGSPAPLPRSFPAEASLIDQSYSYEDFTTYLATVNSLLGQYNSSNAFAITMDHYLGWLNTTSKETKVRQVTTSLQELLNNVTRYISQAKNGTLGVDSTSPMQPVRKYHYVNKEHIIHNGITLNGNIYNTVKVGEQVMKANAFIPSQHVRLLDCNGDIIDPAQNVSGSGNDQIRAGVCQSFLKEEVGEMYRGELILRGYAEIEPWDVVLLNDPSQDMSGPIEVDKVIHSYDQEQGYITIVTPRCLIMVNEASQASYLSLLKYSAEQVINRPFSGTVAALVTGIGATGATFASATTAMTAASAAATAVGSAATSTGAALSSLGAASTIAEAGAALGAATGGVVAGAGLITGTILAPIAVVGSVLLASKGLNILVSSERSMSPIIPIPLSRYGKIWCAGLEGYQLGTFMQLFHDRWEQFLASEYYPLVESFQDLGYIPGKGFGNSTIAGVPNSNIAALNPGTTQAPGIGYYLNTSGVLQKATPQASSTFTSMPAQTETYIAQYAKQYNVPTSLVRGIAWIESKGNPTAQNPTSSAYGVMQLVKATAATLGVNAQNYAQNIEGGAKYLSQLMNMFGQNMNLAIAAYYAGQGTVNKYGPGVPPTQAVNQYLVNVLNAINTLTPAT